MSQPSALTASPRYAEVESRMHAFKSNGNAPIEFWKVSARCLSTRPAFGKYSCVGPSGDNLTDVENFYNYCISHTWKITNWNGAGDDYQQTDTLDSGTFEPTAANVDVDPGNFNGGNAPVWNLSLGYEFGPAYSRSASDWDKSSTRTGILALLDSVNWDALWAGSITENSEFEYNRYGLAADAQGPLPLAGIQLPFPGHAAGEIVGFPGGFGPNLQLTGTVGDFGLNAFSPDAKSISDNLGVSLSRTQIQIRNFRGSPIPYFIYEVAEVAGSVAHTTNLLDLTLGGLNVFYRKISDGVWDHDRQIIQLPDAAMDGPQRVTAPAGTGVRNGTLVSMVVGMTFEYFLENYRALGPSWADYIFT